MSSKEEFTAKRDAFFEKLYGIILELETFTPAEDAQKDWSNDQFRELFEQAMSATRAHLARVDCTDLPWSAIYNTLKGHFADVEWDFDKSEWLKKEEATPQKIEFHINKAAAFVHHWTPKSSESYSSRYTEGYPVRETVEPEFDTSGYVVKEEDTFPAQKLLRLLPANFPRRKYVSLRKGLSKEERAGRHWGQRKLLFNEIEFMNLHAKENFTVVYAGAAPCTHLSIVEDMFRSLDVKYILVDPAPFHVRRSPNIEIRTGAKGLFGDEMAKEFSHIQDKLLFISDIRREHDSEQQILQDMEDQMHWHILMQPQASMFKFRLPWCAGKTPYLNGIVYTQPYAQMHSTETRLIATTSDVVEWDNTIYEEQCFYFNTITRLMDYDHGVKGAGLLNDYDCAGEVAILRQYFSRFDPKWETRTVNEQNSLVSSLSASISRRLGGRRGREFLDRGRKDDMRGLGYRSCDENPINRFFSEFAPKSENPSSDEKIDGDDNVGAQFKGNTGNYTDRGREGAYKGHNGRRSRSRSRDRNKGGNRGRFGPNKHHYRRRQEYPNRGRDYSSSGGDRKRNNYSDGSREVTYYDRKRKDNSDGNDDAPSKRANTNI